MSDPAPGDAFWLTLISGERSGNTVPVVGEHFVIGRGDDADLVVADAKISRHHAVIRRRPGGGFELADLGSSNGTILNGELISSPMPLEGGEQIQLGDTAILVSDELSRRGERTFVPSRTQSVVQQLRLRRSIRRATLVSAAAFASVVVLVVLVATGVLFGGGRSAADVVSEVTPATALVRMLENDEHRATGSGWVLDAERGLVVTAAHVLNGGTAVQVGLAGELYEAEIVAVAPCEDLAVLRVPEPTGAATLPLGSQERIELGDTVVAVGFPGNASSEDALTSTTGVVSVVRTTFESPAGDVPRYSNVLQTDTAINPGSSGGPLVDLEGRLVGVNAAREVSGSGEERVQGQDYAIGVDRVAEVLPGLERGNSIGWLGTTFEYPSEEELARNDWPAGLLVRSAVPGTEAERAGLGDGLALIVGINGEPIESTLASYCETVGNAASGDPAALSVFDTATKRTQVVKTRFE